LTNHVIFLAAAAAAAAVTSGPSSVVRRQKRSAPKEEPEKVDEEEWSLKDVIFVEDSPNFPMIGKVLKVIGEILFIILIVKILFCKCVLSLKMSTRQC
jgi:hypothetical protein